MKISELIVVLQNRLKKHGDVEVFATWEGTAHGIDSDCIYLSKHGTLDINADDNAGKSRSAVDPTEGDDGA